MARWTNWAGTVRADASRVHEPETEGELVAAVRAGGPVKVVGAGHSCAPIAAPDDGTRLILPWRYDRVLSFVDGEVTVQSGMTLCALNDFLAARGYALSNLGSIASQTVAGAISTGTHGSGLHSPALDQQVTRMTVLDAFGRRHYLAAGDDLFAAARVGLGALGVISTVTLRCEPAFTLTPGAQMCSLDACLSSLGELLPLGYFRFWWFPHTPHVQLWWATKGSSAEAGPPAGAVKDRLFELGLWLASRRPSRTARLNDLAARKLIGGEQTGPTLRSDNVLTFPIRIRQSVMEWGLPVDAVHEALDALRRLELKHWMHAPVEVRFAPANDAWLSMAHGRPTCYVGVISYRPYGHGVPFEPYFRDVDRIMADLGGRPHWAKVHYRDPEDLRSRYERWDDFQKARYSMDPEGIFLNDHLRRVLGD